MLYINWRALWEAIGGRQEFLELEQLSNICYWEQIAMRCDGAIASVYDESGLEIENLEVLFTEEGMYIHFLHGMYMYTLPIHVLIWLVFYVYLCRCLSLQVL